MGKKKRQQFRTEVLESPENEEEVKSCCHVTKGVNLNRLKPRRNQKLQQKRLTILDSSASKDQEPFWICLKCAQLDCGHRQHIDSNPADLHNISFNINTKKVWCNICKINIGPNESPKLNKALQYLQHLEQAEDTYKYEVAKSEGNLLIKPEKKEEKEKKDFKEEVKFSVQTPRGIRNLGNTCYFNVVLQCLARTPKFISQLEKLKEDTADNLELNVLKDDPEKMMEARLKLVKWMKFSDQLFKSLAELNVPKSKPYAPIKLLNELHRVSDIIIKDEQNDAHELLREVLQKINEVDLQRLKPATLNVSSTDAVNKEGMDETVHHRIKIYKNHTEEKPIIEEIFGGILVSVLKCQECGSTSCTNEPFLDLSLPIIDKNITSFETNVSRGANCNPKNKHISRQQKKKHTAVINEYNFRKTEGTEHSEADLMDSFKQESTDSWNEESSFEYPLKSPLPTGRHKLGDDEKVLNLSPPCINSADSLPAKFAEINMSSTEETESKDESHKHCITNLNCYSADTTLDVSPERIMAAVQVVESKDSERKCYVKNLKMSSLFCDSPSYSKNVDVSPATPVENTENILIEENTESIMIIAKATETKYQKQESYTKCLALSSPCCKTAGTSTVKALGNSDCTANAAKGAESQDREHENSGKNLAVTTKSVSSLCCESSGSLLSNRDTINSVSVSSEENMDCSVSIHRHTSCSSPMLHDCSSYRPVSHFAFCDDAVGAATNGLDIEISSISLKAAVDEMSSKSSNHIVSPVKLTTSNEVSCNNSEFLDCHAESSSLSVVIDEYSEVNMNQKKILESVRKLNLNSDDNLSSCIPPNYTNDTAGKMSPKMKQRRRKDQSNTRPEQDKNPKYDASRYTLNNCLENFTALELLTDCEKVACSHCTEKNGKGEMVFTASSKQMQIRSAPSILILHLKRFEFKSDGSSKTSKSLKLKKLNIHIQFPILLDISPYIYNENKEKVNLKARQKEYFYSLYAVIEHTGSINQGHYFVYMKSKPTKTDAAHLKDVNENEYEKDGGMSMPTKWFSISDESVQIVNEMDVLKSQAYILFYERCS